MSLEGTGTPTSIPTTIDTDSQEPQLDSGPGSGSGMGSTHGQHELESGSGEDDEDRLARHMRWAALAHAPYWRTALPAVRSAATALATAGVIQVVHGTRNVALDDPAIQGPIRFKRGMFFAFSATLFLLLNQKHVY